LLHTLHHCGLLDKVDASGFRLVSEIRRRKRYRIGYASQGGDTSFEREVHSSLQAGAEREDVELIVVSNRYQPRVAVRNAEQLVRECVDLVIEFQTDEAAAPAIAAKYMEANIPLIAIDIPHPGAIYFGANNYQAGLIAGRYLGQWARNHWNGQVDEVLLLALARAGSLVHARVSGMLAGLKETVREAVDSHPVVTLDGDGQFKTSLEKVRKHLRGSKARHVLVGAANDASALGATRAFQEAGRVGTCAIVGQNGEPDARAELREPRTPLIASVGFFPERYGDGLIKLAFDILAHRQTPPALFIRHHLITRDNVDHFYANDVLLGRLVPTGIA
jgi:ribose transport system substrate-binding protein